jgi:hypothetical protein
MKLGAVALLLSATIVIGIAAFETHALFPVPSNATAKGIVWQGRTFVTRRDFARWLRARGVSYAAWARRHPSLAGIPASRRGAKRAERAGKKSSDWSARNVGGGLAVLAGIGLVVVFVRRRWPDSLESATYAVGLAARRAAPPASRGARIILRRTESAALLTARKAESWARMIGRRGPEFAGSSARRIAPAARRGARRMLGLAAAAAPFSSGLSASPARAIPGRRGEFVWYLATAVVAIGVGVLATVWLNRA